MKKKTTFLIILILTALSLPAFSQSQWDISLNVPYYAGFGDGDGNEYGDFTDYLFLVPDVRWHYYFGSETIKVGAGFRVWTLLIESVLYPTISVESTLGDFVLNANIGGGAFLLFGLANSFETGSLFIPDLSVSYKIGRRKIMRVGAGVMFLISPELTDSFVFVGTGFVRWTF